MILLKIGGSELNTGQVAFGYLATTNEKMADFMNPSPPKPVSFFVRMFESNKKTVALLTSRLQAEKTLHQFQGLGTTDKRDSALFSRNHKEKLSF